MFGFKYTSIKNILNLYYKEGRILKKKKRDRLKLEEHKPTHTSKFIKEEAGPIISKRNTDSKI